MSRMIRCLDSRLGACLPLCFVTGCAPWAPGPLVINEFVATNTVGLEDEAGGTPDWVELHNPSEDEVSLEGWYLSDDLSQLDLQALPESLGISAGDYLVLFLDANPDQGNTHLGFKLSALGEELVLSKEEDGRLSVVDEVRFGALDPDEAMARLPNGTGRWNRAASPSPGRANE